MTTRDIHVGPAPYATGADFCRIFESNMDGLYLLALLLTADHELAERCFVTGLQDARGGSRVFKEWADSWSRRTVILNAIRMVRPSASNSPFAPVKEDLLAGFVSDAPQLRALVALPAFERFVYVVCVLEGYSDHQCALLIGATRKAVMTARVHALATLGDPLVVQRQLRRMGTERQLRPERSLQSPGSPLAATA